MGLLAQNGQCDEDCGGEEGDFQHVRKRIRPEDAGAAADHPGDAGGQRSPKGNGGAAQGAGEEINLHCYRGPGENADDAQRPEPGHAIIGKARSREGMHEKTCGGVQGVVGVGAHRAERIARQGLGLIDEVDDIGIGDDFLGGAECAEQDGCEK